ncbi:hypothetical protein [Caenispirillum bisanense]|uniref:hypothetical protein n=1 Tax=Caenispirillum bisanense TaxID=414052 RepID=UPI0031D5E8BB
MQGYDDAQDPPQVAWMSAPNSYISTFAGSTDFGLISSDQASAIGQPSGPIRLCHGVPGRNGFGLTHIEGYENRLRELNGLGFSSVITYCHYVAENFEAIHEGHSGRLIVARKRLDRRLVHLTLVLDLRSTSDGHVWSIVTGLPKRVLREPVLWQKEGRKGGCEPAPDAASRPRFATLTLPGTRS